MKTDTRDEAFREYSLNGNTWKMMWKIGSPLAFYQTLTTLYALLDTLMASYINAEAVSTVAYLGQVSVLFSAISGGIAIGGGLKIAEAYGKGDYETVKVLVSSLFVVGGLFGLAALLLIPFAGPLLKLANTPLELIKSGTAYFRIELISIAIISFNSIYIAIERARGNAKRISLLNTASVLIKLVLTGIFVYGLRTGITMISVATVIANLFIMVCGLYHLLRGESAFRFSADKVSLKRATLGPIVRLSLPLMVEKATYSVGKIAMNSMSAGYGTMTVGALGISNKVAGLVSNAQSGYQEGATTLMTQNLGAQKYERIIALLKSVFLVNLIIGAFGLVINLLLTDLYSTIFASSSYGLNREFKEIIKTILTLEVIGDSFSWGIGASASSVLYCLGKTKKILIINLCRLFAFRLLPLWIFQNYTSMGVEAVGLVMLLSNTLTAVLSVILMIPDVRKVCREHDIRFRTIPVNTGI